MLPQNRLENLALSKSFRLVAFDESLLTPLMETYYKAWLKDYYLGEEEDEIEDIFRTAHSDDLRLVVSETGEVVGYIQLSRTSDQGMIDEVAVHPMRRRKGIAGALVNLAIDNLGDRTISLVLMDENPARFLYVKLGFVVHKTQ